MSATVGTIESLSARPWTASEAPSRFLIIRLHAIGDVAITLPYCASLRKQFPSAQIDFLTSATCTDLPKALTLFDHVHELPHVKNRWSRLFNVARWCRTMSAYDYDVVVDLQRNWVSRALRRTIRPSAWAEFDRISPKPAGERTLDTFTTAGFSVVPRFKMPVLPDFMNSASRLLHSHGWNGAHTLIVLNPAGLFSTRNWPLENYLRLAHLWRDHDDVQFVMLGTNRIRPKAQFLKAELGDSLINLVGLTSLAEAFAVLQHASGIVSEDSGLMHMAWISGIPTLALFGSSRQDWSRPLGSHSVCLHSGDLECGACMSSTCRFGDVHCLTRYTPEYVFKAAQSIMSRVRKESATA